MFQSFFTKVKIKERREFFHNIKRKIAILISSKEKKFKKLIFSCPFFLQNGYYCIREKNASKESLRIIRSTMLHGRIRYLLLQAFSMN
jgi:hypothetical protein